MIFSTVTSGDFNGRKSVEIVGVLDKTRKLNITNSTKRMDSLKRDVLCICKEDPLLCVPCHLLKFKKMCAFNQERVYCYQKGQGKNLKVRFNVIILF